MIQLFPKKAAASQRTPDGERIVRETMAQMQEDEGQTRRGRVLLTHRAWAKVTAFILVIVMAAVTVASVIGAVAMIEQGFYTMSEEEFREMAFENLAEGVATNVLYWLVNDREQDAKDYLRYKNVAGLSVKAEGDWEMIWHYGTTSSGNLPAVYNSEWFWYEDNSIRLYLYDGMEVAALVQVSVYLPAELDVQDDFWLADRVISLAYALRFWIYAIGVAALIMVIACFVFLLRSSGWRKGYDKPQPGWGTRIPFDVLSAGFLFAVIMIIQLAAESWYYSSELGQGVMLAACALVLMVLGIGWCMSAALRVKLGAWWENTLTYRALRLALMVTKEVLRMLRAILRGSGKVFSRCFALVGKIPLVWKTAVGFAVIALAELFCIMVVGSGRGNLLFLCMLERIVLFPVVIHIALTLRTLQRGGEALASGDLSYQVNTQGMLPDFKRHAENLSRIGEVMTAAVEQRLKSERMKTELITNVSHDIKTPLTSIINYSDLIEKEPCENEKITEYAAVLHRQSERLKRLIEDLVEASKASTGNLEMLLAPCEVGVLLSQTLGEYEQRLEQCELTLVTKQPETPVKILADGRRLWRVFDNLMNNICKYAMPGTRVYLALEESGGEAVISFKNTSREPLELTADELLERFVRGDTSRNSEGNGLGLSIARSLTQLQHGTLELTVDGDLFKAVLRFPTIKQ